MAKRIMVVDDEEDLRFSVSDVLMSYGFEVVSVASREEGLRFLEQKPVDLVLLDIMMPGMSPIEFIRKIKANPNLNGVKVVYLSVVAFTEEGKKELVDAGVVVDYISKPFDNEELINRISKILV